jgi:hypothetical protein
MEDKGFDDNGDNNMEIDNVSDDKGYGITNNIKE